MNLPPIKMDHLTTDELVKYGVICRHWHSHVAGPLPGQSPFIYFRRAGMIQAWDNTELAIAQWVPLGAGLEEIFNSCGGHCDPYAIRKAIDDLKTGRKHDPGTTTN